MKHRAIRAAMAVLWGVCPALPAQARGTPTQPGPGDGPVVVNVGFHIIDFVRLTSREETFDVTAYLELRWHDPALARSAGAEPCIRRLAVGEGWRPRITFDNAAEPPRYHGEPEVEADGLGHVTSRSILTGKFTSPMDLRRFPFDVARLTVRLALLRDDRHVRFEPIPELMGMHDDASLSDWVLSSPVALVEPRRYTPGGDVFSTLAYRVTARRHTAFYLWRVLLPLTLLGAIPWVTFWFEPTNLQPQISTCMAAMIGMVAFGYSVDFALPKVAYLTLLDRHTMIGFLSVGASTLVVARAHAEVIRGRLPRALAVQRLARRLIPAAYLGLAVLNGLSC